MKGYKIIYFLVIGGIGMSALARYFMRMGAKVSGYDKTETQLTQALQAEGIDVHYVEDVNFIPADVDLIVYTPAIPRDNKEFVFLQQSNIKMLKRSQLLSFVSSDLFTIAIAGTHGKTSLSSMVSHMLISSGKDVLAFVGGLMNNYNTNIYISGNPQFCVVEADEYDRSFLQLHPDIALITAVDADHLDIYGNHDNLKEAFVDFANQIKAGGSLLLSSNVEGLNFNCKTLKYGISSNSDLKAENIRINETVYTFDVYYLGEILIKDLVFPYPGKHNIENVLGAIGIALKLGLNTEEISKAVSSFKGIKRRFDFRIKNEQLVYIDDYAHHPKEIEAFVSGVKELYPNKRICGVFQPHLYSRTRDFYDGFAQSLSKLDVVILLDIYPARELPIEGVSSEVLLSKIESENKYLATKENIFELVEKLNPEVFLTIGAGDIDKLVKPFEEYFIKVLEGKS